ncbi:MAG: hypothetical protein NT121_18325 [Chloroflexi bacterium]|nr:hypothetical protein [Chloroflexota bacterium]
MKKSLLTIVVLISILSVLFATAGTSSYRRVNLVSTKYVAGKGVVLIFNVSGKFTTAELLGGSISINHVTYGLHCHEKDDSHIICELPGKLNQFHGVKATGSLAGYGFTTTIPRVTQAYDK